MTLDTTIGNTAPDLTVSGPVFAGRAFRGSGPHGVATGRSAIHKLVLALMWLAIVSSAVVFTEPAPVDVMMIGMIALLPLTGLVHITRSLLMFMCLWLIVATGSFIAAMVSPLIEASTIHSSISLYLYVSAFILAAFIAKQPLRHSQLILNGYMWAALLAAAAGLIGYFDLIPGAVELFTKYGRAAGTFKDPNVFGPFLIPALLYALHMVVRRRSYQAVFPTIVSFILALAILLSFSRGAWMALAVSSVLWAYLSFVTAPTNLQRLKLIAIGLTALVLAALLLALALRSDKISNLFDERASFNQSYDFGPDGRFGGHDKAKVQILQHPLGIGAATFSKLIHRENVHNVYLAMFLNAGWIGGFGYLLIIILTIILGLRHGFARTATQPLFLVIYAAFIGNALQGFVIDTDHWRHFYLQLGLIWGLMCKDRVDMKWSIQSCDTRSACGPRSTTLIKSNSQLTRQATMIGSPDGIDPRRSSGLVLSCNHAPSPTKRPACPPRPSLRRHILNYRLARHIICSRYSRSPIKG